jgi:gluconate 2-dehydrogenase subunit 3-like protein
MTDPAALAAIRAAVETIVPPTDGSRGGADLGVERHVVEQLDRLTPGLPDLIGGLLDAYAADVRPDTSFVQLDLEERGRVIRAMGEDDTQDVREAVSAIFVFTLGGTYSEWSGYDRATGRLDPPASWTDIGYPGPVLGHPVYRQDP